MTVRTPELLDQLYREHPKDFVSARNQLVGELRAAKRRDEAEQVKGLRRPSAAAWLINRVALSEPSLLQEFASAGRGLADAQSRALAGDADAAEEWRAAATREDEAIAAIVQQAEREARDAGHPAAESALDLARETLRAAASDEELREQATRGRLERERSAATLGMPLSGAEPAPASKPAKRRPAAEVKRQAKAEAKRREAEARREVDRLRREHEKAEQAEQSARDRVESTGRALREDKQRLARRKRDTTAARKKLRAAEAGLR